MLPRNLISISGICFLLLILTGCATTPSHFIDHSYPGSAKEGFDIPNPDQKIVIIFNHGSREEWRRDYCTPKLITLPGVIKQLNGKIVNGKEIVLYHHCTTRGVATSVRSGMASRR